MAGVGRLALGLRVFKTGASVPETARKGRQNRGEGLLLLVFARVMPGVASMWRAISACERRRTKVPLIQLEQRDVDR